MKNIIPCLFCLVLVTSCKKDITALPEATASGANTFGARIDGEPWTPQRFTSIGSATILEARYTGTGGVFINARNFKSSPTETEFEIHIRNLAGPGTYQLNQNTARYPNQTASYGYFLKRRVMPLNEWITGESHSGSVTISRFDTVAHIISGTFAFVAASDDSTTAPLSITDGRFDIRIQ